MKHNCTPWFALIVTHQALELWFKPIPAEIRDARNALASPQVPEEAIPNVFITWDESRNLKTRWRYQWWRPPHPKTVSFRDKLPMVSVLSNARWNCFWVWTGNHESNTAVDPAWSLQTRQRLPAGVPSLDSNKSSKKTVWKTPCVLGSIEPPPWFTTPPRWRCTSRRSVHQSHVQLFGNITTHNTSAWLLLPLEEQMSCVAGTMEPLPPSPTSMQKTSKTRRNVPMWNDIALGIIFIESYRELPFSLPSIADWCAGQCRCPNGKLPSPPCSCCGEDYRTTCGPVVLRGWTIWMKRRRFVYSMTYGLRAWYCCRKRLPSLKTLIIIGTLGDLTKNRDYGTFA